MSRKKQRQCQVFHGRNRCKETAVRGLPLCRKHAIRIKNLLMSSVIRTSEP